MPSAYSKEPALRDRRSLDFNPAGPDNLVMLRRLESLVFLALTMTLVTNCFLNDSGLVEDTSSVGGISNTGGATTSTTGGGGTGGEPMGGTGGVPVGGGGAAGGEGGSGGGTWTPTDFGTSLKLWLRADNGVSVQTGVSEWLDQSGNGHSFVQADMTMQPALNPSDVNFNGQPSVSFDGVNDWLQDASASITSNHDHTYWVMLKPATADASNRALTDSSTGREGIWWSSTPLGGKITFFDGGNGRTFDTSTLGVAPLDLIYACDGSSNMARLYQSGFDRGTVANAGYAIGGIVSIGASYLGGSWNFAGEIAELGVIDGVISPTDQMNLRTYLTNRY